MTDIDHLKLFFERQKRVNVLNRHACECNYIRGCFSPILSCFPSVRQAVPWGKVLRRWFFLMIIFSRHFYTYANSISEAAKLVHCIREQDLGSVYALPCNQLPRSVAQGNHVPWTLSYPAPTLDTCSSISSSFFASCLRVVVAWVLVSRKSTVFCSWFCGSGILAQLSWTRNFKSQDIHCGDGNWRFHLSVGFAAHVFGLSLSLSLYVESYPPGPLHVTWTSHSTAGSW